MSTFKCKECGGVVSTNAKVCPHCGAPVQENESESVGTGLIIGGMVLMLVVGIIAMTLNSIAVWAQGHPVTAAVTLGGLGGGAAVLGSRTDLRGLRHVGVLLLVLYGVTLIWPKGGLDTGPASTGGSNGREAVTAVVKEAVRLRREPSTSSQVVRVFSEGEVVKVIPSDTVGDWIAVVAGPSLHTVGYVSRKYIALP